MKKFPVLEKNMPGNLEWEGSFYERLTEDGEWDIDAFWVLHQELYLIAESQSAEISIDRDLAYMLLFIQQRVLNLISANFVKNDVYIISNINIDQLYEFKERFEIAILAIITGELLPEESFNLKNPLLKKT